MISYRPLSLLLKKKSMTVADLANLIGVDTTHFRDFLNKCGYMRLSQLEKICSVLQCGVESVIEWVNEERPAGRTEKKKILKVNWNIVRKAVEERNCSYSKLSRKIGLSATAISQAVRTEGAMRADNLKQLCSVLEIDIKEVMK